jgi:MarR family transcriptional regulator, lower aerobic nicotinate degradation pathway regulator
MVDMTEATGTDATELERLLVALAERMRSAFFARLAAEQLTPPQLAMLRLLDEPRPMSTLGQDLFCDASNVTGMADRLSARGLLERRLDPADRRVRLLALTAKGRRLRSRLERAMVPELPGLVALDPADRAELARLLAAVVDHPG